MSLLDQLTVDTVATDKYLLVAEALSLSLFPGTSSWQINICYGTITLLSVFWQVFKGELNPESNMA